MASFKVGRCLKEVGYSSRYSLRSLNVPFLPASIDYSSPFLSAFSVLCPDHCYLLLLLPPSPLFWTYFPFSIFFVSPVLYKAKYLERSRHFFFPSNSMDRCHKILKVEKNALAAQKETGSASWCCSYYSASTPWKLSVNHLLPPTQPQEEVCWEPWGRSVFLRVPHLNVVWQQCGLSSLCYTMLVCSQLIK